MDGPSRRGFLAAAALPAVAAAPTGPGDLPGSEHWTVKRAGRQEVRLFLWRRNARAAGPVFTGA